MSDDLVPRNFRPVSVSYIFFITLLLFMQARACSTYYSRQRPYRSEYTGSHLNSEVKHCRARSVLGWGTAREALGVLLAFFVPRCYVGGYYPFTVVLTFSSRMLRPLYKLFRIRNGFRHSQRHYIHAVFTDQLRTCRHIHIGHRSHFGSRYHIEACHSQPLFMVPLTVVLICIRATMVSQFSMVFHVFVLIQWV